MPFPTVASGFGRCGGGGFIPSGLKSLAAAAVAMPFPTVASGFSRCGGGGFIPSGLKSLATDGVAMPFSTVASGFSPCGGGGLATHRRSHGAGKEEIPVGQDEQDLRDEMRGRRGQDDAPGEAPPAGGSTAEGKDKAGGGPQNQTPKHQAASVSRDASKKSGCLKFTEIHVIPARPLFLKKTRRTGGGRRGSGCGSGPRPSRGTSRRRSPCSHGSRSDG